MILKRKLVYFGLFSIMMFLVICSCLLIYAHQTSSSNRRIDVERLFDISISKSKPTVCRIRGHRWIVVTSIFYPTPAIYKFLRLESIWNVLIIGDRKTPRDWLSALKANRSRVWFVSIDDQSKLNYSILKYLPEGSYARKNIGYLLAIQCGAKIIFETDDDNLLDTKDIYRLPKIVHSDQVPWISFHRQRSPFVNIYGSFGHPTMWPRGFPIDELKNVTEDGWHSVRRNTDRQTHVYIQQYLADLDPDVDALYRLTSPLSIGRIRFDRSQAPIVVEPWTFSPYNTQNTITYYEAFWGLHLPVTTTFRVCDIWRGFWVQRLLWDIGGRLMFGTATVKQIRNTHSYLKDMDEEFQLYHQSGSFVRFLARWKSTHLTLTERIAQLANDIAQAGFWNSDEVKIINAWLTDLRAVGYRFPAIQPTQSIKSTKKHVAICVTGTAECIDRAWSKTQQELRRQFHDDDADTFLFLSSSNISGPVPIEHRLRETRTFMNSTVTVIYEDRDLHSTREKTQQNWAMGQCSDLVKEYEQKLKIKYDLMIHSRVDVVLPKGIVFSDFNTTKTAGSRFTIGPIEEMYDYMTQLNDANVTRWAKLSSRIDIVPYGSNSCH